MTTKPLVLFALAVLMAGCAVVPARSEERAMPGGRAEEIARILAQADAAQGQPKPLGKLIAALDARGAKPLEPTADPVAQWRAQAEMPDTPPYRGRVLGPAYKAGKIDPGATVRLLQLFDGGRAARVAVATPGQAPLDFTVLDHEAKPVCPPAKARSRECSWTPLFSGRFEIVLSNSSSNAAGYYLVID